MLICCSFFFCIEMSDFVFSPLWILFLYDVL